VWTDTSKPGGEAKSPSIGKENLEILESLAILPSTERSINLLLFFKTSGSRKGIELLFIFL